MNIIMKLKVSATRKRTCGVPDICIEESTIIWIKCLESRGYTNIGKEMKKIS